MTIYEIDKQIEALLDGMVDPDTGEVNEEALDQLEALHMAREEKAENAALAYKNIMAECKAIKAEEDALAKRRKAGENKAERLKSYLDYVLGGENFKTSRVAVTHKKSQAVELGETFMQTATDEFLRFKDPEPNKTAIMAALKAGIVVPGAQLVERTSTTIK